MTCTTDYFLSTDYRYLCLKINTGGPGMSEKMNRSVLFI